MKFASIDNGTKDGELGLISRDLKKVHVVSDIVPTMQALLENWDGYQSALKARYEALNEGHIEATRQTQDCVFLAPLPRAWQWLDGSLFLNHGHLMQQAFHLDPIDGADTYPLVYQGAGHAFTGSTADIDLFNSRHGADFEGEFGVVTTELPAGATEIEALQAIRLVMQLNDISYRALAPREMKTGFGFVQAKGATAFAPFAITPDELGDSWQSGKLNLPLEITRNNKWFGAPLGSDMHFSFQSLIAHVAVSRPIPAGTVFGSGTVSSPNPALGQACIAELRAKEMIADGEPKTEFLCDAETIRMRALDKQGNSVFGDIRQRVVEKG